MLTLHRLPLGYRILYSGVLLFMTLGTAAHTLHQAVRVGISPHAVADWYRGNEHDGAAATALLFPRSFEEVLGDTWLALTTYTLALLIFGAILARADISPRWKAGLLLAYTLGALATAATPPLVRYRAAGFAWLDTVALAALPLLAAAMTLLCMWEMWAPLSEGPRVDPARTV